jgi:hypothetical protein
MTDLDLLLAEAKRKMDAAFGALTAARHAAQWPRPAVDTGEGIPLIPNQCSYGTAAERGFEDEDLFLDAVIACRVLPLSIVATEDGMAADTSRWHSGPSEHSVYVERWERSMDGGDAGRRTFHGWIDSTSRRLTQTG